MQFPNTESHSTEEDVASAWQHVALQVPWFTKEELPIKDPAPLKTYSIGEEISPSIPTSLGWSPPGLAKHRRCALAALTSSLVLSVWASNGKPQDETSWERQLIINDALLERFSGNAMQEESHIESEPGEKLRLRTRIRAFAWAPALPGPQVSNIVGTQLFWGQHIIAVSNEDNQVVVLVVESPTSTLGAEEDWSAEVLNHFSVTPDSECVFSNPSCFDDFMQQQRHISHLAWSPWTVHGDWYHAVLVYATNEDVRARVVTYAHDTVGLGDEVIYPDIEIRHAGPMKWSQRVHDGDKVTLALFTRSEVICLRISASDATILNRTTHHLDGRWDEISGVVWDQMSNISPRLHFCSLSSTMNCPTAVLKLSENGLSALPSPNWREHINDTQILFSARHELKGNAKSKVWGLSAAPLGDFIAAIHTLHPSNMIEYGPPSDRRSIVAINNLMSYNQASLKFPDGNVTTEAIIFTLRKWLENTVEDADHIPEFAERVINKLAQTYAPLQTPASSNGNSTTSYAIADHSQLVVQFKQRAFLDPHTLKDRYNILVSQTCMPTQSNDLAKTLIAFRLATAAQRLPLAVTQATPFSSEIASHHRQLVTLIQTLIDEDAEGELDNSASIAIDPQLQTATAITDTDTCDFCEAAIPFTDLKTAACTNGHQFLRCGLSFLAIQAPRITKYCGICSTPFLSDEFVVAQEEGIRAPSRREVTEMKDRPRIEDEDAEIVEIQHDGEADDEDKRELPVTLARVLFLACDACIYCGGKFAG